ncbi:DapH/DapD/GlmU-related protein [Methanoregula formicica]|uniref:Isoleucine patch superfamily enzyme, carbonic anhydrase/acetyltransferase n=1 Tax=Methanoregula formicica (strain DSM 22288 / NBRC 105244 / SMSP) TaxID=593750 RepID=L0HEJ8_METFS|nr:isoleucine patch superfamily enzyme, carbonic anhydrase/acetyltransferase [Methanoregula formicica SMSP]
MKYGTNSLGSGAQVFEPVTLGFPSRKQMGKTEFKGTTIGRNAVLRSGTIIYCDVTIGDDFSTGHNVMIREDTTIGNKVAIGTASVIEGTCTLGSNISIQSMVFIPTRTTIGNGVFIGPNAVLTNDRYPPTGKPELMGPVIEDNVAIGANVTILPGVRLGRGCGVAAGSVVTKDVPPGVLAIGSPARFRSLPKEMMRS